MLTKYRVSVIVPIYKVRDFIARCAHSLMGQTLQEVEYIFVNDCTSDDSMEVLIDVLKSYPDRASHIRILNHNVNKGLPSARNTGLAAVAGDYIFHCDSDDFVEVEMLEKMVLAADAVDADFVWCDWYLSFETKERYMKEPFAQTQEEVLKNILSGVMKYNVWNKLIRRSVYENSGVKFPDGFGMGEDMTIIRLLPYIKSVAYVGKPFYHYVRTNTEAFTYKISVKHLEALKYNTQLTIDGLYTHYADKYKVEIAHFLQNVKLPFLISANKEDYRTWSSLYKESDEYITSNKKISIRTRILQWCASRGMFWYVRLYYHLVKLYYSGLR